jgi:Spx/MgsR family transcriptional regulator
LYGLKNCDSCRKAQAWLQSHDVSYAFHDIREEGPSESALKRWLTSEHAAKLLNRRSTTWKNLTESEKQSALDNLPALLLNHPTLIKRPVLTHRAQVLAVGFSPAEFEKILQD